MTTEQILLAQESRIAEFFLAGEAELDRLEQDALRAHHTAQVEYLVEAGREDDIIEHLDMERWFRELDPDVADYITEFDY